MAPSNALVMRPAVIILLCYFVASPWLLCQALLCHVLHERGVEVPDTDVYLNAVRRRLLGQGQ